MANLPPGSPNWVNLSYTPTWLFTPVTGHTNSVILHNNGANTVYVGQANVTTGTGLPIPPRSSPVHLPNVTTSLYAISAMSQGALLGTVTTAGSAGTTTFIIGNGTNATNLATTGSIIMVGSTISSSNTEAFLVAGATASTNVSAGYTSSTSLLYYHAIGETVYVAAPTYGQISVRGSLVS